MRQKKTRLHIIGDEEKVVRAHTFQVSASYRQAFAHPYVEFVIVIRGHYQVDIDGLRLEGFPGAGFFFPSGHPRTPRTRVESQTTLLLITAPHERVSHPSLARQVQDRQGRLLAVGSWMKSMTDTGSADDQRRIDNLFTVFLDEYQRLGVDANREYTEKPELLAKAEALVAAHMQGGNLASVCGALNISHTTLNRLFQQHHQCSAQAWQQTQRAEHALHLLHHSQQSLEEVATAIGVSTVRSLDRLMHKYFGASAKKVRQRSVELK